jgi:hypothetical protein
VPKMLLIPKKVSNKYILPFVPRKTAFDPTLHCWYSFIMVVKKLEYNNNFGTRVFGSGQTK